MMTLVDQKDTIREKVVDIICTEVLILADDLVGETKLITDLQINEMDWLSIFNEISTKFLVMPDALGKIEKLQDITIDQIVEVIAKSNV